ncbi:MAG: hypothetical protein GF417_04245, partial [Candidatus Latescibacteria bacterium]|nr:hypothetical protein [bacterium]MBD3423637.1 hypothetical protein [Candidatus Latescibacterota bacterium]
MKNSFAILLCFFALCLARSAVTEELSRQFYFQKPEVVSVSETGAELYIPGCGRKVEPGKPAIPVFSACFLLPPGERVNGVRFESGPAVYLDSRYQIAPAPVQVPTGEDRISHRVNYRDQAIYSMSTPYPSDIGELTGEYSLSGLRIAFVNIYPCRPVPSSGQILFSGMIKVILETGPAPAGRRHPEAAVRKAVKWAERVSSNPNRSNRYLPSDGERLAFSTGSSGQSCYPVVIITSPSLESSFEELASLRTDLGLRTRTVTTDWIEANYSGSDIQERIRTFITEAYFDWQTEYLVLGGDESIIPHRGFYVKAGSEIEPDIPSDLYYSCLDGDWNADGDNYFGEPGEEDLLPELSVGRIPVESASEVQNFTGKLASYRLQPHAGDCTEGLFLGELLWSEYGVDTWGGDYKDEALNGSGNYGFQTAGLPGCFSSELLYDRDHPVSWSASDLIPLINGGVNLVNHLGHTGLHNAMHLSAGNLDLLDNDGTSANPAVFYSQGCYAASFDNRDYAGQVYTEDAIGEQLLTGQSGAVAFIGNSRYGWNAPGSTCGVSQFFDRQFMDALFGEGITAIGPAVDDSRIDNIPYLSYPLVRYVMYGMTLLGDPAMQIWTAQPQQITALHDSLIKPGNNNIDIELTSGSEPVAGALVSVYTRDYSIYRMERTDQSGAVSFCEDVPDTGVLRLRVISSGHFPYADSILINSEPDTLIELGTLLIDDDSTGGSSGDGDGIIENGEIVQLGSIISNRGRTAADSCILKLSCSDPYIAIQD